jgi:hypothetical protein
MAQRGHDSRRYDYGVGLCAQVAENIYTRLGKEDGHVESHTRDWRTAPSQKLEPKNERKNHALYYLLLSVAFLIFTYSFCCSSVGTSV